jgi:hypothetical protein
MKQQLAAFLTLLVAGSLAIGASDPTVPYPEGYRHWTFLHSSMVSSKYSAFGKRPCEKPCTAGIFYFYANDKAMNGLRDGSYEDGAIIAEEMLEYLGNQNGGGKEGQRRMVGVMVRDSQRYSATGGWGYATYEGESRTDNLAAADRNACFQCHVPRKDHAYVFAEYHER